MLKFILFSIPLVMAQVLVIDKSMLEKRTRDQAYVKITGLAQRSSADKTAQLTIYIRNCGQVQIPRNKKGDIPKEGQRLTVFMKERCKIDDWE